MASWISVNGNWIPAKEHAVLPHLTGTSKEIYDGPDRAALLQLYENDPTGKTTTLGKHFKTDPDFLAMVRGLGFNNPDEYLKIIGYDEKEVEDMTKDRISAINKHELPKRIKSINATVSGGTEYGTGRVIREGGFGSAPDL